MEYEQKPVYAIKNEDGTLWNAETNSWDYSISDGVLFTDEDDAQAELDKYLANNFPNAYVVEIGETGSTEQGEPVEVTEDEAEFLQGVSTAIYPFSKIVQEYGHSFKPEDVLSYEVQHKLWKALKNGWKEKPEEPKKYVVFVPGTNQLYDYSKFVPGSIFPTAYISSKVPTVELFTQEEIDAAGLSDCEKKEVKDNGNEHN